MFSLVLFIFACIVPASLGDSCWKRSYGRGVGVPISTCDPDEHKSGALCYPKCKDGYTGVGPVCWQNCPSGFADHGVTCFKPSPYGRGVGYVLWEKSKCERKHPQGCEKHLLMWYPKCKEGFHAVGCCICSPNCQNGMTDAGVSCTKKTYGRTAGKPLRCKPEQEYDAGLCYKKCDHGYYGVGPVCWKSCPRGYTNCGAICETGSCGMKITETVANLALPVIEVAGGVITSDPALIQAGLIDAGINYGNSDGKFNVCT